MESGIGVRILEGGGKGLEEERLGRAPEPGVAVDAAPQQARPGAMAAQDDDGRVVQFGPDFCLAARAKPAEERTTSSYDRPQDAEASSDIETSEVGHGARANTAAAGRDRRARTG